MRALTPGLVLAVTAALVVPLSAQDPLEDARAALDEYFRAWNAEDNAAVAAACNYPRLSLGRNGRVSVREGPADVVTDFERLRQTEGWDHSTIDHAEPLQVAPDKVHFEVVFSRRHADGTVYRTVPSLFIITRQDGEWGLQFQSILPDTFRTP